MQVESIFAHYHYARYLEPKTLYHVISRCEDGAMLLRPDRKGLLQKICVGVMSKALKRYSSVRLYNFAILSNHAHWMVSASKPYELPLFIRYIKVEISRRWGSEMGRKGHLWERKRYVATALPTLKSQEKCFKYILSQGCKEGLVKNPRQWPGAHGAHYWFANQKPLEGLWLNGTAYARARFKAKATNKRVHKEKFYQRTTLKLSRPTHLSLNKQELKAFEQSIAEDAAQRRCGRPALGLEGIYRTPRNKKSELHPVPWLERRATLVAWASPMSELTQEYLHRFKAFQIQFRKASKLWLHCYDDNAIFPKWSHRPGRYVHA